MERLGVYLEFEHKENSADGNFHQIMANNFEEMVKDSINTKQEKYKQLHITVRHLKTRNEQESFRDILKIKVMWI